MRVAVKVAEDEPPSMPSGLVIGGQSFVEPTLPPEPVHSTHTETDSLKETTNDRHVRITLQHNWNHDAIHRTEPTESPWLEPF